MFTFGIWCEKLIEECNPQRHIVHCMWWMTYSDEEWNSEETKQMHATENWTTNVKPNGEERYAFSYINYENRMICRGVVVYCRLR